MRTRLVSSRIHFLILAAFGATLLLSSCGAITEDDLQKWSRNEEGLARITEMMKDDEVPFDIRVRAVQVLVENGWAARIKAIVQAYENPTELADAASEQFAKGLKAEELAQATLARDGIFALMGLLSDAQLDKMQAELVKWIFAGVDASMDRAKIWDELVGPRIGNLAQIKDLGKHAVDPGLILLEKRVEIETFPMISLVDWFLEFNDADIKAKAWEATKKQYRAAFAQMRKNKRIELKLMEELAVLNRFQTADAVMFVSEFIDLVKTVSDKPEDEDILLRYNLIINMQSMLDATVSKEERPKYVDVVLGHLINVLPLIPDYTGETRHAKAVEILKSVGIPGLDAIPLTTTTVDANGKEQKAWKVYLEHWEKDPKTGKLRAVYSPTEFISGVARDYIDQLASKEHEKLLKEFQQNWETKTAEEQKLAAQKAQEEAAKKAAEEAAKKAAAATPEAAAAAPQEPPKAPEATAVEAPKPVMPNFEADPEFRAQLLAQLDKTVTPHLETWVKSPVKLAKVFAIAGFRYLATERSVVLLTGLKLDKTDLSMYFGQGVTAGVLAENAIAAVEYSRKFDELQRANLQKEVILQAELQEIRNAMQSDLLLAPNALTEKYSKLLAERQAKYQKAKEELLSSGRVYARSLRRLCINSITDYPPLTDTVRVERRVKELAQACYSDAYEKTKPKDRPDAKHPLEYFELDLKFCEAAIKIGINQKEILRKQRIKTMVRAWLGGVAEDTFFPSGDPKARNTMSDVLKSAKTWNETDSKIKPVLTDVKTKVFGYLQSPQYAASSKDPSQLITAADLTEYEKELENPELFVLGRILAFYFRYDYKEVAPSQDPKADVVYNQFNLFKDAARKEFGRDGFFKANPEIATFMVDNAQDAFYILLDMGAGLPDEQVLKYWGLKQDELDKYKALVAAMNAVIEKVYAENAAAQKVPAAALETMKKYYPAYPMVVDITYETIRTMAVEAAEAAKKAEEAKKAEAPKPAPAEPAKAPAEPAKAPAAQPAK